VNDTDYASGIATTTPDTKARAIGLLVGGCFFIGWTEMLGLGLATVANNNQQEIGAGTSDLTVAILFALTDFLQPGVFLPAFGPR
jgi:hypothetical protein